MGELKLLNLKKQRDKLKTQIAELYNEKDRQIFNQWKMSIKGTIGTMIVQHHQLHL